MGNDRCEIYCFDENKVKKAKSSLEMVDTVDTSKIFKALADPTRLKIAYALMQEHELCVCDVANIIDSSLATASHHLRLLRNMGLAKYRKEGKMVFYSLDDDHVNQLICLAFDHSKEFRGNGTNSN
ncbi:MAG: metalloregulator ArsR/SmtB family transcription factor [Thermoactinomyces sp.]